MSQQRGISRAVNCPPAFGCNCAQCRLAASNAAIGAAIDGCYPKVSPSILLASESIAPGHLFNRWRF